VKLPEPSAAGIAVPEPGDVSIFPSQRAALRFIPIAAGLFVAQVLLGGLLAHFYIERAGFFGIEELFGIHILQVLLLDREDVAHRSRNTLDRVDVARRRAVPPAASHRP